jgi:hypothetical protein
MPYDEFREGRFFREWVEPQDWIDAANTVLEKSVTSCAYLSVIRGEAYGIISRPQVSRPQVSRLQVSRLQVSCPQVGRSHSCTATSDRLSMLTIALRLRPSSSVDDGGTDGTKIGLA